MRYLTASTIYIKGSFEKRLFLLLVEILTNKYEMTFDEFDYCYWAPPKTPRSSERFIAKTGKFSRIRLNRFYESIDEIMSNNEFLGFDLLKFIDGWEWKSIDIEFSVSFGQGQFDMQLSDETATFVDINAFIYDMVRLLQENKIDCYYGITIRMPNYKMPTVYTSGGGSRWLDQEESNSLRIFNENRDRLDEVIWDISWGNIINRKHFVDEHTVDYLKKELGEENVVSLNEDLVWFNLEGDIRDFDKHKSKTRAKLLKYFEPKMARLKE